MSEKLTQKIFNEEMFATIRILSFGETQASEPFVESALRDLSKDGFDIDDANIEKLVYRFVKRLEKLSGYEYE
jgi:hypothetical protein